MNRRFRRKRTVNGGGGGGSKSVLAPSDLTFRGYLRFPASGVGDLYYSGAPMGSRTVGTSKRIFMWGALSGGVYPLLEFEIPATAPNTTLASSPALTLVKDWGDVLTGFHLTGDVDEGYGIGGMQWDEEHNALWWTYGAAYVPQSNHPTICATVLDDDAGTSATYGPWRFDLSGPNFTRGAMFPLPASFATDNTDGKNVAVVGMMHSGVTSSPFGPSLHAFAFFDPTTMPANTLADPSTTITPTTLIGHDITHKKSRDTRYKTCGWTSPYDCRLGTPIADGITDWGGIDSSTAENDQVRWGVWIDTPTKHGVLYGGQLVRTPLGYTAPGDPDGLVHMWYGDPSHASSTGSDGSGYVNLECCTGQADPYWLATGPGAHFRMPMGWIYDPDDLIAVAAGTVDPWALTPTTDAFEWGAVAPSSAFADAHPPASPSDFDNVPSADHFGLGAFFDSTTNLLYMSWRADLYTTGNLRPLVMVFEVAT